MTYAQPPADDRYALRLTQKAAWIALWGHVIIVIDFALDGLDLVHDAIGALLVVVAAAVCRKGTPSARPSLLGAQVAGWVAAVAAVGATVEPVVSPAIFGMALLLMTLLLVNGFRDVTERSGLTRARRSLDLTFVLVLTIQGALVVLSLMTALFAGTGTTTVDLPPLLVLPVIVVVFVPTIHLLVSLWRVATAAARRLAVPLPPPLAR